MASSGLIVIIVVVFVVSNKQLRARWSAVSAVEECDMQLCSSRIVQNVQVLVFFDLRKRDQMPLIGTADLTLTCGSLGNSWYALPEEVCMGCHCAPWLTLLCVLSHKSTQRVPIWDETPTCSGFQYNTWRAMLCILSGMPPS